MLLVVKNLPHILALVIINISNFFSQHKSMPPGLPPPHNQHCVVVKSHDLHASLPSQYIMFDLCVMNSFYSGLRSVERDQDQKRDPQDYWLSKAVPEGLMSVGEGMV